MIEYEKGAIQVVVMIVAKDLGIKPSLVPERMRKGKITRDQLLRHHPAERNHVIATP